MSNWQFQNLAVYNHFENSLRKNRELDTKTFHKHWIKRKIEPNFKKI